MKTVKIAAIIVTYNRKQLLIECLDKIIYQTKKCDRIFIVDNASTDGTKNFLREKGYLDNPTIEYICLSENTGGAGGFYEGMKRAYEANYDWLWLMDDDGYPAPNCLEKLLISQDNLDIIGSTVVQPNNPSQLTWTLLVFDEKGYFDTRYRVRKYEDLKLRSSDDLYHNYAALFNAVLIHRNLIEQIGLVQKELFIRGDEFEYFLRARKANAKIATRIDAFYYHPYQAVNFNRVKYFYAFRNSFYNYIKYNNITYTPLIRTIYLIFIFGKYLIQTPSLSPQYLWKTVRAVVWAMKGKLISYSSID
jgi:rhamnopyranosyl-N-acetylglucosaminyl-diphospho-decaprenol beta-1,3/1,4-galactofuranosyltransferase